MSAITRYLQLQDGLSDFVGRVISWLVLVMIGALLYEVFMRYLLKSPTIWAHELTTMLFGAFCILGGAYTLRHQGHVRSEVIWGLLPPRGKALCDLIVFTLGAVVLVVMLDMAYDFAARSWASREFSNRSIWQPPLYYIKTVIPVAVGLLLLQNIAEIVRAALTLFGVGYVDPRMTESEPITESH